MRALLDRRPTPEQLPIIRDPTPGVTLIRGAAGSGKTSTALWRLKVAVEFWRARMSDGFVEGPIRVLVLTFNRTLRGYVDALAQDQVNGEGVQLEVSTFGHWGQDLLGWPEVWQEEPRRRIVGERLGLGFPWQPRFIVDEVDYVLGRYLPEDRQRYLTDVRHGRGAPSLSPAIKRRLFDEVITPYIELKERRGLMDWQDEAVELAQRRLADPYHIIVVDESQDFSANQVRAILNHAADESTVTFVLDAAQRIYPHSFLWSEVDVTINHKHTLRENHRNTREVATFSRALVDGLNLTDDGTLPDFESCSRPGPKPVLVPGRFGRQMAYILPQLRQNLERGESSAIVHALGGGWFSFVREQLSVAGIRFVELSGQAEWPRGEENVALSTMASAKGLEFDHVYIVGLNARVTPHGADEDDDLLGVHRRMLAMAAGRSRGTLTIGYKPEEASTLIEYMDPDTYELAQ